MNLHLQFGYDPGSLDEYERGYIEGLTAYAWWKDGVQYVGTCGTTLQAAINDFLKDRQKLKVPMLAPKL